MWKDEKRNENGNMRKRYKWNNLGCEKKKNENEKQNNSIVGNSNRAVFAVFSGFTNDCC
jgi:hypothetical protein